MLVEQGHPDRGIGVQHLLRRDHLDLVRVEIEPELRPRDFLAGVVDPLQGREIPVSALVESFAQGNGHGTVPARSRRRWKSSWNTGKISLRLLTLRMARASPAVTTTP